MTDIELLPLPKWMLEAFTDPTIEMLCEYTRANVAHHTAAQAAEIEALRVRADAMAGEAIKHEARAERLAEALRGALDAVRDTLQDAYQNAGQECCGRGGLQECCGEPEPAWTPDDQAVMDKLGPIERLLSFALRDHDQARGKEVSDEE